MEGSNKHRYLKATRMVVASALLTGVVAVAGCGGGGSKKTAVPPPTSTQSSGNGSLVSAEGTQGLVGPADRSTKGSSQFNDKASKIAANANRKTGAQRHGVAGAADCGDGSATPTADNLDSINATILCLVNAERADNGNLPPLTSNPQLEQAAKGMAARMVAEQFFSHDTPDGKNVVDRVTPTGYIPNSGDWVVGENLAWGSGALSTPQAIVNGWMNSPGHRANILAPDYKDVGLAAALGSPSPSQTGGTTYVNDFGAKSGADLNAKLPAEGGASSGSSGSGDTANSASANVGQTVAGTKSTKKAKKKAKKKVRRHKKH